MNILGIDPGTTESGWVLYDPHAHAVVQKGIHQNAELLDRLEALQDPVLTGQRRDTILGIEMIASQGMAVGAEVFETVVWIGIFMHAWGFEDVVRVTRNQVKVHICGSSKAKDPNVSQAIKDLFPKTGGGKGDRAVGTAKLPGPLWGMSSHMWPALGVALTVWEKIKDKQIAQAPGRRRVRL